MSGACFAPVCTNCNGDRGGAQQFAHSSLCEVKQYHKEQQIMMEIEAKSREDGRVSHTGVCNITTTVLQPLFPCGKLTFIAIPQKRHI
jgi:hypothetical protein